MESHKDDQQSEPKPAVDQQQATVEEEEDYSLE